MVALYILYALVQAILVARYGLGPKDRDDPVFTVVLMTVFAPLVSIVVAGCSIHYAITWLVTYGKK